MADGSKANVDKGTTVAAPKYPWYTIRKLQAVATVDGGFVYSLRKYMVQFEVIDIVKIKLRPI